MLSIIPWDVKFEKIILMLENNFELHILLLVHKQPVANT